MRFEVNLSEASIPSFVDRLLGITGAEPWVKRLRWIRREVTENPHMLDWLRSRFSMEWEFGKAITAGYFRRKDGTDHYADTLYEIASFATGAVRIHEELSVRGRNRFCGQLMDGLKSDKGLLSLQHEVATVVHLVRAGFDVDLHDLETGGGFDFLAKKGGVEIEVECKTFSADVGRKIHRRVAAKLFNIVQTSLLPVCRSVRCGIMVRVTLPERLTPASAQHDGIRQTVELALLAAQRVSSEHCTVDVQEFAIASSPFCSMDVNEIDQESVRKFVAELTGNKNPTLMIVTNPGERAVLVVLESRQADAVLDGIRRQLRDASVNQFSKSRPACLVAQLHDLSDEQMLNIASADSSIRQRASGLQVMTSDLLQNPSRAHVHSIVYRACGKVVVKDGAISSSGATYIMKNAWHPMASDSRCSVFGNIGL